MDGTLNLTTFRMNHSQQDWTHFQPRLSLMTNLNALLYSKASEKFALQQAR